MFKRMRISLIAAMAAVILIVFPSIGIYAGQSFTIVEPKLTEDGIQVFLKGLDEAEEPEILVGTSVGSINTIEKISSGQNQIYTLVLIDNSNSIKENNKKKTKAMLESLVLGLLKNEKMAIATYDDKNVNYLCDYEDDGLELQEAIAKLKDSYSTHSSFLTDILCELIDNYTIPDNTFWRIFVISDGSDRNGGKYMTSELDERLKEKYIPIYTMCCYEKNKNVEDMKWLTSLSRQSKGLDFNLTETENPDDITRALRQEASIIRLTFSVSDDMKTGSKYTTKISVAGESDSIDIKMPQETKVVTEAPEDTQEDDKENDSEKDLDDKEKEEKDTKNVKDDDDENEDEEGGSFVDFLKDNLVLVCICGGIILVAIIVLIIVIIANRKKKKGFTIISPADTNNSFGNSFNNSVNNGNGFNNVNNNFGQQNQPMTSQNAFDMSDQSDGRTMQLFSGAALSNESYIKLIKVDGSWERRYPITSEIKIGRKNCDCTIDFDPSISSTHCAINKQGNRYFIRDLNSTNGVLINGTKIGTEFELVSGTEFTIGRTTLRFEVVR